jgi:hypothetical protein
LESIWWGEGRWEEKLGSQLEYGESFGHEEEKVDKMEQGIRKGDD